MSFFSGRKKIAKKILKCVFVLFICLYLYKKQKQNNMTTQTEIQKRLDLVKDPKFVNNCIKAAKRLGITPKQWNENKAGILMMFANEVIGLENKN